MLTYPYGRPSAAQRAPEPALTVTNPPDLDPVDVDLDARDLLRAGEIVVNARDVVTPDGLTYGRLYGVAPESGPIYPVVPHRRPEAFILTWDLGRVRSYPARFRTYGEAVAWIEGVDLH